ncbi:MAG TPA: methyltransferase domain-containing protein [Methylomirabilota bacterium]|nr:methyltransferase domain-containing protein [Methylomirabilota bacterium]
MKPRLRDILVCPRCRGGLSLRADRVEADDVVTGALVCPPCAATYAITAGIPRFVTGDAYAESFGEEWHRFRTVQIDSSNHSAESQGSFAAKTGLGPEDVRGRVVLDAGVGAGRYAEVMARWGAEVVGVDLTRAVDAAAQNLRGRPGVHLVQADIFALPFRDETFDVAYAIGVLHHTPDTAGAFRKVAALVKKGGALAIYVYFSGGLARYVSDVFRKVTTRLPRTLVYYGSTVAVPLYFLHRLPVIGRVSQVVAPTTMHPDWRWRWLDTFDWYTPKYQWKHRYPEVIRWFREAGFIDLYVADEPICVRGLKVDAR